MRNQQRKTVELTQLNNFVINDPAQVVENAETSFDNQLRKLAQIIIDNPLGHKVLMLSGTSASGKTTTALKLTDMLKQKVATKTISIDDFWRNREEVPLLEDGSQDYESINILNIPLLSNCIKALVSGQTASMPKFDFHSYRSMPDSYELTLSENDIVIIEGIQALNSVILEQIDDSRVMKLYADVQMEYTFEGKQAFSWRDLRFLRRMVRDNRFRHYPPSGTIEMWDGVIGAEEVYTIPFAVQADMVINTGFNYELNSLKKYAMPLLETIFESNYRNYGQYSKQLYNMLSKLIDLDEQYIPDNSITREFIGGCSYYKK